MSFRAIALSEDIQLNFAEATKSPGAVSDNVSEVAAKLRDEYAESFSETTEFSVTLDEWRSCHNDVYLNVIADTSTATYNLGVTPVMASA